MHECKRCKCKTDKGWYCEDCQWIMNSKRNDHNDLGTTNFKPEMRRFANGKPNFKSEFYDIQLEKQRLRLKRRR